MKEENKPEYKQNIRIEITAIEAEQDQKNSEIVRKIKFETNQGVISYKPTIIRTNYIDGFKTTIKDSIKVYEIPDKIKLMNDTIKKLGAVHVLANFMAWTMEGKLYKYIQGNKQMEEWQIIDQTTTTE